jgi:hypothetical protein
MAKQPRRSINDALADIAAQGSNVAPLSRDHVVTDSVTTDHVATPSRDHVAPGHVVGSVDQDGYRMRMRREKPHVSLYAHPKVFATIRDLAAAQRKKPHDLYAEGMRLMLAKYGFDFDALNKG